MPETLDTLISQLSADNLMFADVLAFIERHYHYQPQPFDNGPLHNVAGENQGSCKILGLALLEGLSTEQALLCFGEHYRHVLVTPDGNDHANIRQLMQNGLEPVSFSTLPLTRKAAL
ncbi:HopJ type III effector protein [Thiopseudomonas denitrificans]|uniref:HopJ type III effector protein n=1 Tax=Thiopseudomonas denitrificans TaxID=1501432 RepID=A0A4R6TY90_9GAMM|nr:HopJ type III effector protein [Thiopseudomonas denitrificans]TDQ38890.1 HopJ type III effector protein [Thiopseudomonas denitrificans]